MVSFHLRRYPLIVAALVFSLSLTQMGHADSEFTARLAPMPVDFRSAKQITGLGELRGKLTGSSLILEGSFSGLAGPATVARLHAAPPAIPGPAIAELQITQSTQGKISGSLDLDTEQLIQLSERSLYVQINSKAAPEGNLRGWLFAVSDKD